MTAPAQARVSYTLEQAAETTGISLSTLRRAQAEGALRFHYVTSKPVVLHSDLVSWIEASPIESRRTA